VRVLITGGAGFIGSSLAKNFIEQNRYEIFLVDDLSKGLEENIPSSVNFIKMDLSDRRSVSNLPDVDIIIHLCGQSSGERSFDDVVKDLDSNYKSTVNLVQYAIQRGIKKFIFSSSMSVYGDGDLVPKTPYGVHKLASEHLLRTFSSDFSHCILRLNNVYGPGQDMKDMKQGMVSIFISQALNQGEIHIKGSMNRERDFVYINDVILLIKHLVEQQDFENMIVDVNSGEISTVRKLIGIISDHIRVSKTSIIAGTRGDQFSVPKKPDTFKELMGRPATSLKEGLSEWIKTLKDK
jgi:UDP-glucose 4-epimerase